MFIDFSNYRKAKIDLDKWESRETDLWAVKVKKGVNPKLIADRHGQDMLFGVDGKKQTNNKEQETKNKNKKK